MEGRHSTDLILALCSTSLIVSSGISKDIGLKFMQDWGVEVFWMPACVGLAFTPLLMIGTWLLHQIPEPRYSILAFNLKRPHSVEEIIKRSGRKAMGAKERMAFVVEIWPGLVCILVAFFLASSYREYRDMFMVEILRDLGSEIAPGMMSKSEILVGFVIGILAACIVFIRSNKWGFMANALSMTAGFVTIGLVALFVDDLSVFLFLVLSGIGVNLIYVPMEAGYFERMIAFLKMDGASASLPLLINGIHPYTNPALIIPHTIKALLETLAEF